MTKAPAKADGKKLRLTVFLIKDGYDNIVDFLEAGALTQIKVETQGVSGVLFVKSGAPTTPSWVSIFGDVPGFKPHLLVNRSSRAVYVTKENDRWFCFTFGYTRHLLNEAAVERNFGLIVSLNLGDPDAIKAIDKTNISHIGLQSREQAGRDVGFDGFEFNSDIDLLKSMTAKGPEKDGEEQETYSGRDSITVYTRVTLGALAELAKKLYKAFKSTSYKKRYPWIDKITQERDPTVLTELEDALVKAINSGDTAKVWMAVPEIIVWEDVENFAYRIPIESPKKAGPALYPDIDLEGWLAETKLEGHVTLSHLTNRKVYQIFKDGRAPAGWSVYRCLNAEIDFKKHKYILNDGDWYAVDGQYVNEVSTFYQEIPVSTLTLPNYGTKTEPVYLAGIPNSHPQFALMDRKTVMIGGGRSRVEFCDLYSKAGDIVHVKKYGGSSVLSHLFAQAVVSGECFLHEAPFRHEVNQHLPTDFRWLNPTVAPKGTDFTICIAVMSKVSGPLELPFFSKVSLRNAVVALRRMNFRVTKLKIDR
jgi:uncharacterized protein (TIGR04141 family)